MPDTLGPCAVVEAGGWTSLKSKAGAQLCVRISESSSSSDEGNDPVAEMAEYMGFDLVSEPWLRTVAEEALHAKLPDGWVEKEVPGDDGELVTEYVHAQYGLKQHEHPLDNYFEQKLAEARQSHAQKSTASEIANEHTRKTVMTANPEKTEKESRVKIEAEIAAKETADAEAKFRAERASAAAAEAAAKAEEEEEFARALRQQQLSVAARRCQAARRGELGRREFARALRQQQLSVAARRCQAARRGELGRREFARALRQQQLSVAARRCQAARRGELGRRAAAVAKKRHRAERVLLQLKARRSAKVAEAKAVTNVDREILVAEPIDATATARVKAPVSEARPHEAEQRSSARYGRRSVGVARSSAFQADGTDNQLKSNATDTSSPSRNNSNEISTERAGAIITAAHDRRQDAALGAPFDTQKADTGQGMDMSVRSSPTAGDDQIVSAENSALTGSLSSRRGDKSHATINQLCAVEEGINSFDRGLPSEEQPLSSAKSMRGLEAIEKRAEALLAQVRESAGTSDLIAAQPANSQSQHGNLHPDPTVTASVDLNPDARSSGLEALDARVQAVLAQVEMRQNLSEAATAVQAWWRGHNYRRTRSEVATAGPGLEADMIDSIGSSAKESVSALGKTEDCAAQDMKSNALVHDAHSEEPLLQNHERADVNKDQVELRRQLEEKDLALKAARELQREMETISNTKLAELQNELLIVSQTAVTAQSERSELERQVQAEAEAKATAEKQLRELEEAAQTATDAKLQQEYVAMQAAAAAEQNKLQKLLDDKDMELRDMRSRTKPEIDAIVSAQKAASGAAAALELEMAKRESYQEEVEALTTARRSVEIQLQNANEMKLALEDERAMLVKKAADGQAVLQEQLDVKEYELREALQKQDSATHEVDKANKEEVVALTEALAREESKRRIVEQQVRSENAARAEIESQLQTLRAKSTDTVANLQKERAILQAEADRDREVLQEQLDAKEAALQNALQDPNNRGANDGMEIEFEIDNVVEGWQDSEDNLVEFQSETDAEEACQRTTDAQLKETIDASALKIQELEAAAAEASRELMDARVQAVKWRDQAEALQRTHSNERHEEATVTADAEVNDVANTDLDAEPSTPSSDYGGSDDGSDDDAFYHDDGHENSVAVRGRPTNSEPGTPEESNAKQRKRLEEERVYRRRLQEKVDEEMQVRLATERRLQTIEAAEVHLQREKQAWHEQAQREQESLKLQLEEKGKELQEAHQKHSLQVAVDHQAKALELQNLNYTAEQRFQDRLVEDRAKIEAAAAEKVADMKAQLETKEMELHDLLQKQDEHEKATAQLSESLDESKALAAMHQDRLSSLEEAASRNCSHTDLQPTQNLQTKAFETQRQVEKHAPSSSESQLRQSNGIRDATQHLLQQQDLHLQSIQDHAAKQQAQLERRLASKEEQLAEQIRIGQLDFSTRELAGAPPPCSAASTHSSHDQVSATQGAAIANLQQHLLMQQQHMMSTMMQQQQQQISAASPIARSPPEETHAQIKAMRDDLRAVIRQQQELQEDLQRQHQLHQQQMQKHLIISEQTLEQQLSPEHRNSPAKAAMIEDEIRKAVAVELKRERKYKTEVATLREQLASLRHSSGADHRKRKPSQRMRHGAFHSVSDRDKVPLRNDAIQSSANSASACDELSSGLESFSAISEITHDGQAFDEYKQTDSAISSRREKFQNVVAASATALGNEDEKRATTHTLAAPTQNSSAEVLIYPIDIEEYAVTKARVRPSRTSASLQRVESWLSDTVQPSCELGRHGGELQHISFQNHVSDRRERRKRRQYLRQNRLQHSADVADTAGSRRKSAAGRQSRDICGGKLRKERSSNHAHRINEGYIREQTLRVRNPGVAVGGGLSRPGSHRRRLKSNAVTPNTKRMPTASSTPMWAVPRGSSTADSDSAVISHRMMEPASSEIEARSGAGGLRCFVERSMAAASAALAQRGQPEAARRVLSRALAATTAAASEEDSLELLPPLQNALSCALRRLGRQTEALQILEQAVQLNAERTRKLEDVSSAREHGRSSVAMVEAALVDANTQLNLCAVLSELGRHTEALAAANSALTLLQPLWANNIHLDRMPLLKMVRHAKHNQAVAKSALDAGTASSDATNGTKKPTKDGDV
eukprot:SAG31_NODE_410_length_15989_cov_237.233984_5_plen_2134_part_00